MSDSEFRSLTVRVSSRPPLHLLADNFHLLVGPKGAARWGRMSVPGEVVENDSRLKEGEYDELLKLALRVFELFSVREASEGGEASDIKVMLLALGTPAGRLSLTMEVKEQGEASEAAQALIGYAEQIVLRFEVEAG